MKKSVKIALLVSLCLLLLGGVIFGITVFAIGGDFDKASTVRYADKECTIEESFSDISIKGSGDNIRIKRSTTGTCKVEYMEAEKIGYTISVNEGVLTIAEWDNRKWYDYMGVYFGSTAMTVYLPDVEYGALCVRLNSGDVTVAKDFTFASAEIVTDSGNIDFYAKARTHVRVEASSGDILMEETTAKTVAVKTSSGNVKLKGVITQEETTIRCSSGNVRLIDCDGGSYEIKTSSGNVKGSLLTSKNFQATTGSGNIRVPQTTTGGICKISTSSGNISFTVQP